MNIFDSNSIVKEISVRDDLTIVVVTHNRIDLLSLLIKSLDTAFLKYGDFKCGLVFCINGKDSLTENYLKTLQKQLDHDKIQIISLDRPVTPAEARNIATASVHTEWVMFLDDDVEIPPDLFFNFKKLVISDPKASIWGGPNLTPKASSQTQQKIGWLLQSYMVTGPISSRYKLNNIEALECKGTYLSLCNMFIKTKDFRSILFNSDLKTAEENELIFRFSQNNKKMKTSDLLYVWHYRRASVPQFLSQIKNYGFGRGQLIYHGMISTQVKLLTLVILTALIYLVIKFPLLISLGGVLWLMIIFVKLEFDFKFKNNKWSDIFLPVRLWINYFSGIISGYRSSSRIKNDL